jgi:hypothetical protein
MLRTATLGTLSLILGLTLGLGVLVGATASAKEASGTGAKFQPWGKTRAPDQVLRKGCRSYKYRYAVNPPGSDWTAEVFLVEPGGDILGSATYFPASDPATATRYWRICRTTTTAGRFKMRMKVVWYDGFDSHVGWVKPGYFRLALPR